ncbi:MAG: bifunctional riboflavin kinase/FAD synthetase [Candidatus Dormibacteraeota bacterium]|nr:bifunctional riboflavin kinase/FAD synthetase [Candidatus Dormibacteraeota bacterium]
MRVDHGLVARRDGDAPVVLTIGNFDGVHRGHQALLADVSRVAREAAAEATVVTFDPHPRCVLDPAHCPQSLTVPSEKSSRLEACAVDRLVVLPFTREVSRWSAEQFCDLLVASFDVAALVVGHDFALGRKRQGDFEFLRAYGGCHGFPVAQVDVVTAGLPEPVSSSAIRALLSEGDVLAASVQLGYPYLLDGVVEHGDEVGRHLGFPTANLGVPVGKCLPAPGVYAMWVHIDGDWRMAATNVGYRPTFGGDRITVEAYVLDYDGDLYGRELRAAFVERLREERKYPGVDELVRQIVQDVDEVRAMLRQAPRPAL